MILNSKELIEKEIVTHVDNSSCIQQVGIDLEVQHISEVEGIGLIYKDKTNLPDYSVIMPADTIHGFGWILEPGYYEVEYYQGCNMLKNTTGFIRQRSSLLRSGAQIHSSIFDPGFKTDSIGCFIQVWKHIFIEERARICQFYVHSNTPVEDTYTGQFQNDKQRK